MPTTRMRDELFAEAITDDSRVALVKRCYEHAMSSDPKTAAPYMRLILDFLFTKPKQEHDVEEVNLEEVFTTEVCDGVWREVIAEARLRDARSETPVLGIIDAEVVETTKGNGRQKTNGQARNGRKKKAKGRNSKNGPTRKG